MSGDVAFDHISSNKSAVIGADHPSEYATDFSQRIHCADRAGNCFVNTWSKATTVLGK